MERTTIDLWVGVFVVMGMAALFGLATKVGNLTSSNLGDTYTITAAFDNIGGLKRNAPVKSAGVVIGRVDNIKFDPTRYEAVATLKIDKRYKFSKDTDASILTAGLLGEQYLGLETGGDTVTLKEGDEVARTQDAIVLEKLISKFMFSKASEGAAPAPVNASDDGLTANPLNKAESALAK